MKNKGFTLIELLAVIVILAIIALIATPVILGIIEDSQKSANERSAEMMKSGVQNAYTSYLMANNGEYPTAITDFLTQKFYTVDGSTATGSTVKTDDNKVSCDVTHSGSTFTLTCKGTFTDGSSKTSTFTGNLATAG